MGVLNICASIYLFNLRVKTKIKYIIVPSRLVKDITFTTIIKQWQHCYVHACFTMLFTHKQNLHVCELARRHTEKSIQREQITHFIRLLLSCFLLSQIWTYYYSFQFDYSQHVNYSIISVHTQSTISTKTIANWILNVFNAALKLIRWNVLFVGSKWIDHLQAKNHYTIEAHHFVMHRHEKPPHRATWARARAALACSCKCIHNWKTHF